jgi:formylglycine-generating enzyme required for sulfatase activity
MVVIPAGTFLMGSLPNGVGYDPVEGPQHRVKIPRPIAISKFPVTFSQWETCANNRGCYHNPAMSGGINVVGDEPAVYMTWSEAANYAFWLATVTGKRYRLLSEAEYEYASRAGTQTVYPWGDGVNLNGSPMANCNGCGGRWDNRQTAPVGSFPPNNFGLYDMVGNIAEWVADCSHDDSATYTGAEIVNYDGAPADGSSRWRGFGCNSHIVRGGSFMDSPAAVRTAGRMYQYDIKPGNTLGFRVARDLEP